MSIITRMLKQTAVYWERTGTNAYGEASFANPVEIEVRWEGRREIFFTVEGREEYSDAVVYVDRDMDVGDWLKLGDLTSSEATDPRNATEAFMVRGRRYTPSFRATETLREMFL